jgi:hypothetical protein
MKLRGLVMVLSMLMGFTLQGVHAQESTEDLDVVVVSGRQPGPPMWKVTSGENTLWILPIVPVVPKNIEWDDSRVAELIADSEEAIDPPGVSLSVSKKLIFNPVNWVRGPRLVKRLSRNPGERTLEQVLPAELWQRYAALKQRYFERDKDIDTMRPSFAIGAVSHTILKEERLRGPKEIVKHVEKLIDKRKSVRRTKTEVEEKVEGSYADLSARLEKLVDSLPKDDEIGCFDTQLKLFEHRIGDMKRVANAWATGNARDMESYSTLGEMDDPCTRLLLASSEGGYMERLIAESSQRWMTSAEAALARNHSTFAVLPMIYIKGSRSLVDQLAAKGYTVHAPL